MGILDNFFGRSDSPPVPKREKIQKMIKEIENRKSQTQMKLAREREQINPDKLKVDKLEREVRMWDSQKQRLERNLKEI